LVSRRIARNTVMGKPPGKRKRPGELPNHILNGRE
jgi:hypothetical protein